MIKCQNNNINRWYLCQKELLISLICTQCGNKQIIIRLLSKLHKAGHNKHIWCINCKKETLHKENPIHKESLEKYK